jgi:peptidoglycan/xylan/chitin deacetylase (PgdA/CDA1 family)
MLSLAAGDITPMSRLAKIVLCGLYKHSGAMRAQEFLNHRSGRTAMTVLVFHRVTDEIPEDGLTVSTARFRRICAMLRRGFRVVPLGEVFRIARSGEPVPRRTVAITFDDCYGDNLLAARVLAEHRLPACFFVPTAFVGTQHVFPWDQGLKPLANLSWDEVREMADLGFEIGSHSVTHPDFGTIAAAQARQEFVESRACLEDQLGRRVRWFAFPFGMRQNFRLEWLRLAEDAGYEGVVSAYGGSIRRGDAAQVLPREAVPFFDSVLQLELHLAGCLFWFYRLKRRLSPRLRPASALDKVRNDAQPAHL